MKRDPRYTEMRQQLDELQQQCAKLVAQVRMMDLPVPMRLTCPDPKCGALHLDEGEFATRPHHTHACQSCGNVWRPAIVATVGVRFLPGFKNGAKP